MTSPRIDQLQKHIAPLRERLGAHPVYQSLRSLEDVHTFLSLHVFAVWDFMSLLKALQRNLTCVDEIWRPVSDSNSCRLINDIVLGEESDEIRGKFTSHFEMYVAAVRQSGGSMAHIDEVLRRLDQGQTIEQALTAAPTPARRFSTTTFDVVQSGCLPAIAASFTIGREDLIPLMFTELVRDLHEQGHADTSILIDYLERHIEVDGGEHGPMAEQLLINVCGDDDANWCHAETAAANALRARIGLWDGVVEAVSGHARAPAANAAAG